MKRLTSEKILEMIRKEKDRLKRIGVKKIGVFGSFIRDKQNKKSDVDVLVEFDKITFDNYFLLLALLEKMFKKKVDLIIESDLKPELNYVKKEAKYVKI